MNFASLTGVRAGPAMAIEWGVAGGEHHRATDGEAQRLTFGRV